MNKIIAINILILFVISSLIIISSPIFIDLYKHQLKKIISEDKRPELPNYSEINWAKKHFEEFNLLSTSYYDYIVFRRDDFRGETITIKNGYRVNKNEESFNLKKDIWVFGGSAAWGTGSRNEETIPALIEKISGISTLNLGETGYHTSQSLNLLIREIVNHKPKIVIFYDGVNDIYHKCRTISNYFASAQEREIKNKLDGKFSYTKNLIIAPLKVTEEIAERFNTKKTVKYFDCDTNEEKARNIVKVFINNWQIVKSITEKNNIKFIPILQPTAFSSKSNLNHIDLEQDVKIQFQIMYEMIKKELENSNLKYLNLENSLDEKEFYFIDWMHVSPNGNYEIANKIVNSNLFNN